MEAGRPSREVVDGNIPSKKNSIEYTYDDNGKLIKQTEISGDGKTTSSTKFDRNGNDNTAQIKRIQQIKTEEIEQRVFVTYKFTLAL